MQTLTHHLWIGFAGGLLAFAHCLGMCGGFVVHLSQAKDRNRMLATQSLWQFGRILTYTLLGALAGFAGGFLEATFLDHPLFRNLLTYLAGGIIVVMGLSLLGLLPVRGKGALGAGASSLALVCGRLFSGSSAGVVLSMGIATGFLPCPIILAFLAYALQSGSVATGMATMAALGVGTMVPLLTLGGITRLSRLHLQSWAPKAGGIILILLGISTSLRGTEFLHHLIGCPPKPVIQQAASSEPPKPCCIGKPHGDVNSQ
ncbi:sulfite exporter TauE/SafE family protein [Geomonas sp.]|uniref:sulfite exporter TauE/SafE family protein n=1 Tax=Geomonas sp. TaxID=2651584 RepID=UPI002B4A8FD3|nr:sulfite exporter TauE/SafE family protein [Geomonas sp.]HJV34192.1 sulfite exporter TauE/SafE family protein [Geomonas sp.]